MLKYTLMGLRAVWGFAEWIWWAVGFYVGSTLLGQSKRWTVAHGVVIEDGQVLLIKRPTPRVWEFPGGGIEKGEPPADAAVREVWEETGLRVEVIREIGLYQRPGFRPHDGIAFLCKRSGGDLSANHESVAMRFFPVDRLPRGLLPWYREVIEDALQPMATPYVRRQWLGPRAVLAAIAIVAGERLGWLE
jgi:8-oxo-dGTP pyrophosphatase MutT (NUDIX family)